MIIIGLLFLFFLLLFLIMCMRVKCIFISILVFWRRVSCGPDSRPPHLCLLSAGLASMCHYTSHILFCCCCSVHSFSVEVYSNTEIRCRHLLHPFPPRLSSSTSHSSALHRQSWLLVWARWGSSCHVWFGMSVYCCRATQGRRNWCPEILSPSTRATFYFYYYHNLCSLVLTYQIKR